MSLIFKKKTLFLKKVLTRSPGGGPQVSWSCCCDGHCLEVTLHKLRGALRFQVWVDTQSDSGSYVSLLNP